MGLSGGFKAEKKRRDGVLIWDVNVRELNDGDAKLMAQEFLEQIKAEVKSKWIFYAKHVETENLEPPDMKAIVEVVEILLKSEKESRNLLGCVIQGKSIDDKVKMAVNIFNTVFGQDTRLCVVDSPEESDRVINTLIEKRVKP